MTLQRSIYIGHKHHVDPLQALAVNLNPGYLTRHIGIFGATGTGKTTTAASIVKQLACPVIVLDAKGDLGGLGDVVAPWQGAQMPVARLGSDLLRRALDLSEAQSGALEIALAWAEDTGQPCTTLNDLAAILQRMAGADLSRYGLVSLQSVAAVQRAILRFQRAAPWAFGSNEFDPFRTRSDRMVIHAPDLVAVHGLYATFAVRLLEQVYTCLEELGDAGAPGLAILIDEAHLLFQDAPIAVTRRLEQIVRLIRSKGVCLIFVSQAPSDLPSAILGQLATRVQHGLRAGTASQQAAARAAAETMPGDVTAAMILELAMGEAFVSTPDTSGKPMQATLVKVKPVTIPNRVFPDVPPTQSFSLTPASREICNHQMQVREIAARLPPVRKRRAWYFWPLVAAAVIYGPMIVLG